MYHGKNKTEWEHTASLLHRITLITTGEKTPEVDFFNPYKREKKKKKPIVKADISVLKYFCKN